jgi:hypothetical protein
MTSKTPIGQNPQNLPIKINPRRFPTNNRPVPKAQKKTKNHQQQIPREAKRDRQPFITTIHHGCLTLTHPKNSHQRPSTRPYLKRPRAPLVGAAIYEHFLRQISGLPRWKV